MVFDLDWSKINNEKLFQRLSNHLFSFECGYSGFVPSSPYIGKDGGWDGRWKGTYERLAGLFSIQAKWTSKNFKPALTYLQSQIAEELKNARRQKVDHLIITTNAQLRDEHVAQLERLKGRKLKTLQIWHNEKLTLKLQTHSFLCHSYFGNAQFPAFVPPPVYFSIYEEMLLKVSLIGRKPELSEYTKLLLADKPSITVLHAPGGYGKSHFLKATASLLNRRRKFQILFIRPFLRNLEDAFQDELVAGRSYLLFLDDADRCPLEMQRVIALSRTKQNIKAVLACRTAGLSLVTNELRTQRVQHHTIRELKDLDLPELKEILFLAAGKRSIDKAEQIVHALNGIPYLIVQYGRRIGRTIADEELANIYKLLGEAVAEDTGKILNGTVDSSDQGELLLHLATVVPFSKNSNSVTLFAEILQKRAALINHSLEKLLAGKVLRLVGQSLRFYPDMAGDIFLANAVDNDPSIAQRLFDQWFDHFPSQVLANLSSAASFDKTHAINSMLSRVIHGWIQSAKNDTSWKRVQKLKHLERIAHLVPFESFNLIHTYLNDTQLLNSEGSQPNLDDFGPVIERLSLQPGFQIETLHVIKRLEELALQGRFDTYKPSRMIRYLVSPLHRSVSVIKDVLNQLLAWVQIKEVPLIDAQLAAEAAKEILSAGHEYTESFQDKFTIGERILNHTPGVIALRQIAIDIFRALLRNKEYRRLALDIADDIGSSPMHRVDEQNVPLGDQIKIDRQTVLAEISAVDLNHLSCVELSAIEDLLLKWWLMNKPGTEHAVDVLGRLERSAKYKFIKRYISPDWVVDDFEHVRQEAPADDRWTWWWDSYGSPSSRRDSKDLQDLARQLSGKHKNANEIKEFLIDVESAIASFNPWPNPPILQFWVHQNPEPFLALAQPDEWNSIPPRFQGHISSAIVKYNQSYVEFKCRDILDKLPDIPGNELHDFMTMITVNRSPYEVLKETFFEIAKRGNNSSRGYFIYRLYFYFEPTKDGDAYLELICEATHDDLTKPYCDHLAFSLHALKRDWTISNRGLFENLRSKVRPLLKDLEKLDYHARELVEFVCGSDLGEYIGVIEEPIDAAKTASESRTPRRGFAVVPYDGIPSIRKAIKEQEQFNQFVGKVIEWKTHDSLGQFDVSHLLKSISDICNESQESMLALWITSKLTAASEQSFNDVLSVMQLLDFGHLDEKLYLLLLETGSKINLFNRAKSVFQWYLDSGAIENQMGEVPKIFNQKRDICKRLIEQATPGIVKSYLQERLREIDHSIIDHLDEDQEWLDQK
jgi:hypothetical protein